MQHDSELRFDLREIPFSVRGSWLNVSPVIALHTASDDLHLVSHQNGMHAVLRFSVESGGETVESEYSASPSTVAWRTAAGVVEGSFENVDTVRVRGEGVDFRIADATAVLTPFTGAYFFEDPIDRSAVFTSYETGRRYRVTAIRGELRFDGSEALGAGARAVIVHGSPGWEVAIEEFETARAPYSAPADFETVRRDAAGSFAAYAQSIAGWRSGLSPAAELAAYVLWSATVEPRGFLGRESVLMSKHWMDKVWSWDHCFNALALAAGEPSMAMDQFLAPFDHQEAAGALPDSVTHSEILYNFVKPPIHGWALAKLRVDIDLNRAALAEIYERLSRWSLFWLDFRRVPGHDVPHYQHGNDSGWDNSTAFDYDRTLESPDLAAFLIVQLDVLASLAEELGDDQAARWHRERDALLRALMAELWNGEEFIARGALSGRESKSSSLLTLLPIVAGKFLPVEVADKVAARIATHLTAFGPATQLPGSDEYEDDGYWRGPIWAPSTILIEDGLRRTGYLELADQVSSRFRALCELSGFAENFDAMTGAGLRDRAYTWTASAYLLLAREAERRIES